MTSSDTQHIGRGRLNSIGEAVGPLHLCGIELSNHFLLRVAAFSFLLFVLAEVVGAFASNSLSLLGDAAAMSVDVFTYFCNMYSEHVKAKYGSVDLTTRMVLEVGIPLFSVTALIGVSAWITYEAIVIILHPSGDDVNVWFLYGFAAANALIDIICAALFYLRRKDVLKTDLDRSIQKKLIDGNDGKEIPDEYRSNESTCSGATTTIINLNMASALTHVGGDTLRTGAVFVAALVSSVSHRNSTMCDAWAAVVVTVTILFLVVPLLKEIRTAYLNLQKEKTVLGGAKAAEEHVGTTRLSESTF